MNQTYLPSKEFRKRVLIIILVALGLFGIYKAFPIVKQKISNTFGPKDVLVKEVVAQDSNDNGIQDWEEALWGLDPNKDGEENRRYIETKKAEMNGTPINTDGNSTTNEEDQIAREFLALIVSLQQSGNLNEETMKNIAVSISSKIEVPQIPDRYTATMVKTQSTTPLTIKSYYNNFQSLVKKYEEEDLGNELQYIAHSLNTGDEQSMRIAVLIGESYIAFGEELMNITTPSSLKSLHLSLANTYEKMGQSVKNMEDIKNNSLKSMSAIAAYNQYADLLLKDLETLQTFFIRNAIL